MPSRRQVLRTLSGAPLLAAVLPAAPTLPPPEATADEDYWRRVRALYPLTHDRVYLNAAGLGPAPFPVLDAVQQTMWRLQTVSEHGHALIEAARAPVAAFLGADPEEIAFTRNATEANATIASGFRTLGPGDEVIFESHAHPGGSIPWLVMQREHAIRIKIFEPDPGSTAGNLERIEALITPRTRVVQVSHVTAPTGIRFPVHEIARLARARGLWFHIDGAQSAGMIPIDLHEIGCDSYATSGHKWMGGPHGTGILYIRKDRLDDIVPTETGAYSDASYTLPDAFEYYPTARRFEPGTRDAAQIAGLVAAVDFLQHIGMARIAERGQALATYLREQLRTIDGVTTLTPEAPARSGSITTFRTRQLPADHLAPHLWREHGLRCRVVGERGLDGIRISTHLFNSFEECDRVAEALRTTLR